MTTLLDEARAVRRLPPPAIARLIRQNARISQERLAAELGVHRVTLARWEAGASSPRGSTRVHYVRLLQQIADAT